MAADAQQAAGNVQDAAPGAQQATVDAQQAAVIVQGAAPGAQRATEDMQQAAVIVACGGSGARFRGSSAAEHGAGGFAEHSAGAQEAGAGGFAEKQFLMLAGKPVLAHTLDVLEAHPRVKLIVLVLPQHLVSVGESMAKGHWPAHSGEGDAYAKVQALLAGGEDRQASVEKGLDALAGLGWRGPVLVQDGVRPCTPSQVYDRVIEGVLAKGNAVAAIPLRDTVKRADSGGIVCETLDREGLWQIQTPQGFWMDDLREAYTEGRRRGLRATDDASLVEALGQRVHLVEGYPANVKLTYPGDAALLEALLQRRQGNV